jgi:hypothetical protein
VPDDPDRRLLPIWNWLELRSDRCWPDLRNAGTAYVDLALALPHARYTDGYETVWFYQRLSAACARHRQ